MNKLIIVTVIQSEIFALNVFPSNFTMRFRLVFIELETQRRVHISYEKVVILFIFRFSICFHYKQKNSRGNFDLPIERVEKSVPRPLGRF